MKINVQDKKGAKVEEITLSKKMFENEPNEQLLAQYVHVYKSNQRQGTSSTKTRAEVRGGGKKPWRQKGTGRARHGSIRSPIWVHGGIAHGPKPKETKRTLPKKMRKAAMLSVLSFKAKNKSIKVIDEIKMKKPKTKDMEKMFDKLKLEGRVLVVTEKSDRNVVKSLSNIAGVEVATFDTVNVYQLLNSDSVLFEKGAVTNLEKRFK
jgi:large subunit ribosomal protein L4